MECDEVIKSKPITSCNLVLINVFVVIAKNHLRFFLMMYKIMYYMSFYWYYHIAWNASWNFINYIYMQTVI